MCTQECVYALILKTETLGLKAARKLPSNPQSSGSQPS